jgi:hypothetical protein
MSDLRTKIGSIIGYNVLIAGDDTYVYTDKLTDALESLIAEERRNAVEEAFDRLDGLDFSEGNDSTIPPAAHRWMDRIVSDMFPPS